MRLLYRTKHLQQCASEDKEAMRTWGPQVGTRRATENVAGLYELHQLRFHPLKGDRANQFSITLTGAWRIILTTPDETTAVIEEVTNHYDD